MATVLPFKALRPAIDKVHMVASRSVDAYSASEIKERMARNPYTFLHVINPDYDDGVKTKPGSIERLTKVKNNFSAFVKDAVFIRDEKPAYYIYRQLKGGMEYLGIIACTSIDDYLKGVIKVHEQTITQREEKLKEYLEVCEFNAEPVLFCYPHDETLDAVVTSISQGHPDYDFSTTDRAHHTLWVVNDEVRVQLISKRFEAIPSIYIADGHHRSASSALLGIARRKAQKDFTGKEPFNYFLGVFFDEAHLKIYDYNRLVHDMNGLELPNLIKQLETKFEVNEVQRTVFKPTRKHEISMYTAGKWFSLIAREGTYNSADPVGSLDASILTEHVLSPLFGIHDLKTDKRMGFVPGVKGADELKKNVDEGKAAVAFGLFPVTMEQLKWIADTDNIMPPKSTWVEPKMRSGLIIYSFDEGMG